VRAVPVVTEDLVRRVHRVGEDFMLGWLEGIRDRPGNPRDLSIERFGEAIAPVCPGSPNVDFLNRVMGLSAADAERVPDIVAFYRRHGVRPWFEVIPGEGSGLVTKSLAEAGAEETAFRSMLYGAAELPDPDPAAPLEVRPDSAAGGVEVRTIRADEMALFSDVFVRGHEVPDEVRDEATDDKVHWATMPNWRLYLATAGGRPAAVAVLTISAGLGYLANAATVPEWRGHGCQAALIRRRIADAGSAGCELVCSGADLDSTSQHNLERAGMRIAYTHTVWRVAAGAADRSG